MLHCPGDPTIVLLFYGLILVILLDTLPLGVTIIPKLPFLESLIHLRSEDDAQSTAKRPARSSFRRTITRPRYIRHHMLGPASYMYVGTDNSKQYTPVVRSNNPECWWRSLECQGKKHVLTMPPSCSSFQTQTLRYHRQRQTTSLKQLSGPYPALLPILVGSRPSSRRR